MGRTSISLPDELVARLEPLKGQINISQICQIALEAKAHVHEQILATLSNDDVMKGLVERLKIQKAEAIDQSRAWGEDDGQNWMIGNATYQEGERWGSRSEHYRPVSNSYEADSPDWVDEEGDGYIRLWIPDSIVAQGLLDGRRDHAKRNNLPFEMKPYASGFTDSVREIWSRIRDEL